MVGGQCSFLLGRSKVRDEGVVVQEAESYLFSIHVFDLIFFQFKFSDSVSQLL